MKRALIHIGSGKTGSTSIQKSLILSAKKKHNDFVFPIVDHLGNQNIDCLFKDTKKISRALRGRLKSEGVDLNEYKRCFKKKFLEECENFDNLVISSEYLFNFNDEEVSNFFSFLNDDLKIDEVAVVCYLRNPSDYYLSFVQQKIKASAKYPIPNDFRYKMIESIQLWKSYFPNMIVKEFSKKCLFNSDVVSDFNRILNDFFRIMNSLESVKVNEGLSAACMVVLQDYRKNIYSEENDVFKKSSSKLLRMLIELSSESDRPYLKEDVVAIIQKNHEKQIRYFQSNYGLFKESCFLEKVTNNYFDPFDVNDILVSKVEQADVLKIYAKIVEKLMSA